MNSDEEQIQREGESDWIAGSNHAESQMIERYEPTIEGESYDTGPSAEMREDELGRWVRYSDYQALELVQQKSDAVIKDEFVKRKRLQVALEAAYAWMDNCGELTIRDRPLTDQIEAALREVK